MDIVERLRGAPMVSNENGYTGISRMGGAMLNEAADEIERLRKALKVIANSSEEWGAFAQEALQQKDSE